MSVVWWISATAEILMVQGVGVTIGAVFESFPRGHDCSLSVENLQYIRRHDLSSVFMTVGDADTVHLSRSPSAEKHVRIGLGHETALEGIWLGTSLG